MHKTHIVLEDWQYEALQALATQEQRSLSAVLRELLTSHLAAHRETAQQRLAVMEGIGTDAHATGHDHDTWLYSARR